MEGNAELKQKAGISALAFTSLGHFLNDGFTFLFPVIADVFSTGSTYGYPPLMITGMLGSFYGASAVFGLFASSNADRGTRIGGIHVGILLISTGITGFGASLISLSLPYYAIIAFSVVMGMGTGFYHPIGAAILQKTYRSEVRGRVLGINGSMGSVGRAVFSLIFLAMAAVITQGNTLIILAGVGLAGSFLIWYGLRKVRAAQPGRKAKTTVNDVINMSIVVLTAVVFTRAIASQGMVAWIPTFLTYSKGVGVGTNLGIVLLIMYGSAIVGQPIFGLLVDRMDKRLLLFTSSIGTAATMFFYMNTTGDLELVFLSLFGFFTFSGFPLTMSLASDYAPRGSSSLTNSVVWGFGSSGGMVLGPVLAGAIILQDYARIPFSFEILIVLSIIVAFAALALPKSGKRTKMPMFG